MKTDERLEEQLRDLFTALVTEEPPLRSPARTPARSPRRRIFRSAKWSIAPAIVKGFATAGLAGAVAVGAVMAPRIARDDNPDDTGGLVSPTSTASAEPAPPPPVPTTTYRNPRIGFALEHPKTWRRTGDAALGEDFVAFVSPNDQPTTRFALWQQGDQACDACPVGVPVRMVSFAAHDEYVRLMRTIVTRWRRQGIAVTERGSTVAGRATAAFHVVWPDRAPADPNDQEWCRGCVADWFLVQWHQDTTLDVRVVALDAAAWTRDGARGLQVVRSIRDIGAPGARPAPTPPPATGATGAPKPEPSGDPAPDCTPTNGGFVMTSIVESCDTASEAILRFAAKRIDGAGAEVWMTKRARDDYDAPGDDMWLYTPPGERAYKSYFVTERAYLSDGRIRFTLEMNQGFVGDEPDRVRTERVYVGGGTAWDGSATPNGMVVVSAELISGPDQGGRLSL